MLKRLSLAAALAVLAACDLPLVSDRDHPSVRAHAEAPTLSVTNAGGRTVRYLVFERSDLALILWGRCTPEQAECATLAPGQTERIPYSAIAMYDEGDAEAVVYWWIDEPAPGGGNDIAAEGSLVVAL